MATAAATQPAERTSAGAWWTLSVLVLLYILAMIDRNALAIIAEPIKRDLGLSDTQMGLALGPAFTLTYALAGIPFGWAADRLPRRFVIYGGAALWSVGSLATGLVQSLGALVAARATVGVGEAALSPSAYSLLADKFPKRRLGLALGLYQAGINLGAAAAFTMVALILGNEARINALLPFTQGWAPWRLAMIMTGAPVLLLALLVFTFTEPARGATSGAPVAAATAGDAPPDEFLPFLRREWRLLSLIMVGCGCLVVSTYGLQAWTPSYLQRRFGMTPVDFAPALGLIGMVSAATLLFKGALIDWLYARGRRDAHIRIYTLIVLVCLPACYALFLVESSALFMALYGVVQVLVTPFLVFVLPALQLVAPPAIRGRISAMLLFTVSAMGALGPVVIGLMVDHVFGDPARLGTALAITLSTSVTVSWLMLRTSLPLMRRAVA